MKFHRPDVNRIDRISPVQPGAEQRTRSKPVADREGVAGEDTVKISSEAKMLAAAQKKLAELPEIRADKVKALKEAIESGTYRPSADRIAEAMLREGRRD